MDKSTESISTTRSSFCPMHSPDLKHVSLQHNTGTASDQKSAASKTTEEAESDRPRATSSSHHSYVTSSVHSTAPVITSCSLSTYPALQFTAAGYTIDVPATIGCACNDDWEAGVGSTVGADSSTTYTCQVTSTHIAVSTGAPKPVAATATATATAQSVMKTKTKTSLGLLVPTSTQAPAYQKGQCTLHIFQVAKDDTSPLYVQLNTTDASTESSHKLLASKDFKLNWGGTADIPASDSALGQDVSVELRQAGRSRKLRPREGGPVGKPDWQAWIVGIAVGNRKWDSTDTAMPYPYCNVGDWYNGTVADFLDGIITLGADQFQPVSFFNRVNRKDVYGRY